MNLLPLPALDGGRVLFLLLNGVFTLCSARRSTAKYEGYVHLAGLAALMALSLMVPSATWERLGICGLKGRRP